MGKNQSKAYIPIVGTHFGFPEGMAATQRARRIAELVESAGYDAEVLIARPTQRSGQIADLHASGCSDGVAYRYPGGIVRVSKSKIVRFIQAAFSLRATARYILYRKPVAIIIYCRYSPYIRLFLHFIRRSKSLLIFEVCEWPMTQEVAKVSAGYFSALNAVDYEKLISRRADGVISISRYITNRLLDLGVRSKSIFELPVLVGRLCERHSSHGLSMGGSVVFCGSLTYWSEVCCLIDAVAILKRRNIEITVKFYFGSSYQDGNREKFDSYISKMAIEDRIQTFGFVSYDELQKGMGSALCLVCLLREADVSRARFPNKIAEYLGLGCPVIATRIGEVERYLVDGVSAFLVEPDSADSVAQAIEKIVNSPVLSKQIGDAGKELASRAFSVMNYVGGFSDFMNDQVLHKEGSGCNKEH